MVTFGKYLFARSRAYFDGVKIPFQTPRDQTPLQLHQNSHLSGGMLLTQSFAIWPHIAIDFMQSHSLSLEGWDDICKAFFAGT